MLQAGTATAAVVLRNYSDRLAAGVLVYAGPGNNGGDAYVVAAQLARAGVRVRLVAVGEPRTDDAKRAAAIAARFLNTRNTRASLAQALSGSEHLVVDGLLGTGHRGELRDAIAEACVQLSRHRARGATVVALDIPSGLDATTGALANGATAAHVTTTYGTIKRGLLVSRAAAGRIVLLDIGLGLHASGRDDAWRLAALADLPGLLPPLAWNAHKGTRGHLTLVGGTSGMAGAMVLATRAALASGVGLARAYVDEPGISVMQSSAPQAIANTWRALHDYADAHAPAHAQAHPKLHAPAHATHKHTPTHSPSDRGWDARGSRAAHCTRRFTPIRMSPWCSMPMPSR